MHGRILRQKIKKGKEKGGKYATIGKFCSISQYITCINHIELTAIVLCILRKSTRAPPPQFFQPDECDCFCDCDYDCDHDRDCAETLSFETR